MTLDVCLATDCDVEERVIDVSGKGSFISAGGNMIEDLMIKRSY